MAKMFICDVCDKHEPPSSYDGVPTGWISITGVKPSYGTSHVCSPRCLVQLADKLVTPTLETAGVANG